MTNGFPCSRSIMLAIGNRLLSFNRSYKNATRDVPGVILHAGFNSLQADIQIFI